ncbi:hypothetical protein [Pontiella sulfatireligans]|uniref:Uncharacterized protein n=1 Tax=Pontiella sulfatireligans TaxID=2750658 RepID=A0A6C2UPP3_9BACT|nr:hypothetical protein [Pontiella sulfatireligans]VGO21241.1 hypothetical protein SCARR_03313 [Pontiella sulfatireligans]
MKLFIFSLLILAGISTHAGTVGLPLERMSIPAVTGDYSICIWDDSASDWYTEFAPYDGSGFFNFQVPEWDNWYWIGLWDAKSESYIFGKWIGHFKVN